MDGANATDQPTGQGQSGPGAGEGPGPPDGPAPGGDRPSDAPPPALNLAGPGPGERLNAAKALAAVAKPFITDHHLFATIVYSKGTPKEKTSYHVNFEGWTFLGAAAGDTLGDAIFAVPIWTKRLTKAQDGMEGWEARVEARTSGGLLVGAADAECTRAEDRWARSPDFQVRSMAQTRAASKALRIPLGWVMRLAGFEATPAEEMDQAANGAPPAPHQAPRQAQGRARGQGKQAPPPDPEAQQKKAMLALAQSQWPLWVETQGQQVVICTALNLPHKGQGAFTRYWLGNGGTYAQAKAFLAEVRRAGGTGEGDAASQLLAAIAQVDAYSQLVGPQQDADDQGQTPLPM